MALALLDVRNAYTDAILEEEVFTSRKIEGSATLNGQNNQDQAVKMKHSFQGKLEVPCIMTSLHMDVLLT